MTAVVLLADLPPVATSGTGRVSRLAVEPGRPGVAALLAHLAPELEESGRVLALYPTWANPALPRQLALVRSALETGRLVPVGLDLPPLALAVLGEYAAAVAVHLDTPGPLFAGIGSLAERMTIGAWSSRPGRRAGAATWHRLLSVVPGVRFAVTAQPPVGVRFVRQASPPPSEWRLRGRRSLSIAGRPRHTRWAREAVREEIRPARMSVLDPLPGAARWWGSRRVTEIVVCPDTPARSARQLAAAFPCRPCPWCGESVFGDRCPCCAMTDHPRVSAASGERSPQ